MKRFFLTACLALLGFCAFSQQKQFTVYEAISGFTHKPNLGVDGLKNVRLFYHSSLITDDKIDEEKLDRWAISVRNNGDAVVCDFIDVWKLQKNFTPEGAAEFIGKVNAKFHEYSPKVKIATYGLPVLVNLNLGLYRAEQKGGSADTYLDVWRRSNAHLIGAANACDVLFPSLYIVDMNVKQWLENLKTTVEYCREVCPGKPVIPFIQMQYYNEKGSDLALEYIDAKVWTAMLEGLYEYADGVVIYALGRDVDNKTRVDWDDERVQNIYNATLKFMKKHKTNKPVRR